MSLLDALRPGTPGPVPPPVAPVPAAIPVDVKKCIDRGRKAMLRDAPKRRLCIRFERGDTYWYLNEKGVLDFQSTVTRVNGGGKPRHRIRNTYNFIRPIVEDKVSAATQRVPSYDISPSTTDPEDYAAAKIAEKVALYGYDKWRIRNTTTKVVKNAIAGGGEGYALPYFDPNVGPYTEMPDGTMVGAGEVRLLVLSGNEVYWEAGVDFYESRWHAIEQARPIEDVKEMPGFIPGTQLTPDARTSDIPTDNPDKDGLVMVTEFFDRPCPKYPDGRRLILSQGRPIVDYRLVDPDCQTWWEPYPLRDSNDEVIDEPILHRLVYTVDPDSDRDFGLVWQLIDPQRTVQDCWNKLLEWKNRCLNPQMLAPVNSLVDRPTDVPGDVRYFRPMGQMKPEWEQPPQVPQALFQMLNQMKQDMKEMAAYEDIHADPNLAAQTVQAVISRSEARWQSFLGDLAEWHSRLMRHCLLLVARYYTEPRLLVIRGRFGAEPITDFKGAQLMGQVDVTVLPGSLEYRTKQQVTTQVLAYADRGWISPQQAMAAIDGGTAEKLIESYQLDVARANRVIQKIRDGSVMDMPTRTQTDPATGQELVGPDGLPAQVPTYMPDVQDNVSVWQAVFGDWMKTEEFDQLDPAMQEVSKQIWSGLQHQQQAQAMQAAQQQQSMAEQLGMSNAAKPQGPKPPPTQPGSGAGPPAAPPSPA